MKILHIRSTSIDSAGKETDEHLNKVVAAGLDLNSIVGFFTDIRSESGAHMEHFKSDAGEFIVDFDLLIERYVVLDDHSREPVSREVAMIIGKKLELTDITFFSEKAPSPTPQRRPATSRYGVGRGGCHAVTCQALFLNRKVSLLIPTGIG